MDGGWRRRGSGTTPFPLSPSHLMPCPPPPPFLTVLVGGCQPPVKPPPLTGAVWRRRSTVSSLKYYAHKVLMGKPTPITPGMAAMSTGQPPLGRQPRNFRLWVGLNFCLGGGGVVPPSPHMRDLFKLACGLWHTTHGARPSVYGGMENGNRLERRLFSYVCSFL